MATYPHQNALGIEGRATRSLIAMLASSKTVDLAGEPHSVDENGRVNYAHFLSADLGKICICGQHRGTNG